jgi:hypothetical protein
MNRKLVLLILPLVTFAVTSFAKPVNYGCTLRASGLANHLDITENDGDLVKFEYVAVSIDVSPPFPSCSIDGEKQGDRADETSWRKTATGYTIKMIGSMNEDDSVVIKKISNGYLFDFSGFSPLNCGPSSGIAKKITINLNRKKCRIQKVRN